MNWQEGLPPKDEGYEQFLVMNNRRNCAVVMWSKESNMWLQMFSSGRPSSFLNGGCGSVITHWCRIIRPQR